MIPMLRSVSVLEPFHMDTLKPGQTQFHTLEVWNADL